MFPHVQRWARGGFARQKVPGRQAPEKTQSPGNKIRGVEGGRQDPHPLLLDLGPVRVRASGRLDVTIRAPAATATATAPSPAPSVTAQKTLVDVPYTHWLMATTGFGMMIGSRFTGTTGAIIGGFVGFAWGTSRWKRRAE
jgi:hypothetical protein